MSSGGGLDEEDVREAKDAARSYGRYGALGLQVVVFIVLCSWGGHALDGRMGNDTPWFTLAGVVLGMVAAFWTLFKEVRRSGR